MGMIVIEENGARREVDETILVKTEGSHDNDNESAQWQEWRLNGVLVKRDAQVQLKRLPPGFPGLGKFS